MSESYFGHQRDWSWRGWSIRYSYTPTLAVTAAAPILLIHGFGASLGHWRSNIEPLSRTRSVYAIDLLGCGASEKPLSVEYTVDLWVEQIYAFWQEHIQQPIILSGHSLGGLIAVTLAARYPKTAKGLCLISCADGPHPEEYPAPIAWAIERICEAVVCAIGLPCIYPFFFRQLRQEKSLKKAIANVYKLKCRVDLELVKIFQAPAFEQGAEIVLLELLRAILIRRFESPRLLLPQIEVPILVIWGQEDPAVPSFFADKFKQWKPSIQLIKLPGIGHCAHDELPQWVSTLISEWAAATELGSVEYVLRNQ
ncbi:alpha/beta fold hydrolase [Synechococcus sp. PCC 7336]|uniref:alpha/beta fold hydrolase n=1 Tax=Synechococcus sp. PCC 7336 TaxID=195250 RepID=UPI00034890BD|nr:alpha/beta fold hydrolase [Synechococcus sp. PCC 7336]